MRILIIASMVIATIRVNAQDTRMDSLLIEQEIQRILKEDSLLLASDSSSLLGIIDSLLAMPMPELSSQLMLRLGYNSNVSSTGRTLGISEFGLSPAIAYYHKSGLYADLSGFWSPEFDPSYYLTVGTLGYLAAPTDAWSLMAEYTRFQYADDETYVKYNNSLGVTNFWQWKKLIFRLDYQFFFGDSIGHRVTPSIGLNFEKRNWAKLKRLRFFPSVNVLLGSERIEEKTVAYTTRPLEVLLRIRNGLPLFYMVPPRTEFGVMNYSLNLPLSITAQDWTFMISYTYNFPKLLPGESAGDNLTDNGFISATIFRSINFKSSRKK